MPDEIFAELSPGLREKFTERWLFEPIAWIHGVVVDSGPGVHFRAVAPGYHLLAYHSGDGRLCLERNGIVCGVEMPLGSTKRIILSWTPTSLEVQAGSNKETIQTPLAGPPYEVRDWLRRKSLIPQTTYPDAAAVLDTVIQHIENISAKIKDTGAVAGFWDVTYDGQRILERIPKRETELTEVLGMHLSDLELTKNIRVLRETPAGSGRMDFLFIGTLDSGKSVPICCEVKRFHSDDVAHGLQKQLPEYMKLKATSFGIFAMLDFGPKYPPVSVLDFPEWPGDKVVSAFNLFPAANRLPGTIRLVTIPMFKDPSPSSL
jgi:hypothetical protein